MSANTELQQAEERLFKELQTHLPALSRHECEEVLKIVKQNGFLLTEAKRRLVKIATMWYANGAEKAASDIQSLLKTAIQALKRE